jgi:hypothetical protein
MAGRDHAGLARDSTHCRAICDEIGERLRCALSREASEIPPFLRELVDRLAGLERVDAPSIVPSIDDTDASVVLGKAVREAALA